MKCPNCQKVLPAGSSFCNKCGYELPPGPVAPPVTYVKPAKDPSTALVIELVGTLFGFMGLGWLYAGYTSRGILLLFGWLIVVAMAVGVSVVSGGLFLCLWVPAQIAAAVVSGLMVKQAVERAQRMQ